MMNWTLWKMNDHAQGSCFADDSCFPAAFKMGVE